MGIRVRDFERKTNPGKVIRAGLIANELSLIFPEAVGAPDPKTGMYAISRSVLIPPMIKHMQEMQEDIETLEDEISILKARLDALEGE